MSQIHRNGVESPNSQSLNQQPGYYYKPYPIVFGDGNRALAVRAPVYGNGAPIVDALGLHSYRAALLISGGAALMDPYDIERIRPLLTEGIARYAEAHHVVVIDGGTRAGVMLLLGEIRRQHGFHFPLVGVTPVGAICYPGHESPHGEFLDSNHSHFVLTDGSQFGQESATMAQMTRVIADRGNRRGLSVIINGGEVARQETYERATEPEHGLPLLVLEGSGRFADDVARAAGGEPSDDTRIDKIVQNGEVKIVSMDDGPEHLYAQLALFLA